MHHWLVEAIYTLSEIPQAVGQVFNIGSTEEVAISELAERVRTRAKSQSDIQYIPYEQAYETGFEDFRRRVPSLDKIKAAVEWEPSTSLDTPLTRLLTITGRN